MVECKAVNLEVIGSNPIGTENKQVYYGRQTLHYTTFTRVINYDPSKSKDSSKKTVKALFLTYTGLLRVLFVSRNKNAETFTIWATQKLFTMQMGSKEAKEILGTEVLNIKIENYRAVFDPIGNENNRVCHGRQTLVEL